MVMVFSFKGRLKLSGNCLYKRQRVWLLEARNLAISDYMSPFVSAGNALFT